MPRNNKCNHTQPANDHPLIAAGFVSEQHLLEVWNISPDYFPQWLRRQTGLRYRTIGGIRWFHVDNIQKWLTDAETQPPEDC